MDENKRGSRQSGERRFDFDRHGEPDEGLPELPTKYDLPYGEETEADGELPALESDLQAEFLRPDVDLDKYLSLDDLEQQEEDAPQESVRRRASAPESGKKSGLLGFLKRRQAEPQEEAPVAPVDPDGYPDSDPDPDDTPDEADDTAGGELDSGRLYALHTGARGKAEQEARSYIAALQAESGVAGRRDRRTAAEYRVGLDDLLGIDSGEAAPSSAPAESEAEEPEYDFDLDQALDYDADVRQYRPKKERQRYTPDQGEPEIDARFNLGGQTAGKTISYADTAVDLSADEDYVPAQQTEYNPSQWTPDYDDPLAERVDDAEPPRKKHRPLFGRARRAAQAPAEETPAAPEAEDEDAAAISDSAASPAIYAANADYSAAPESMDGLEGDEDFDDYDDEDDAGTRRYRESELYAPPSFREYVLSILASVWLKLRGTVRGNTAVTMQDSEEDLGPELSPAEASKYYGSFLRSMKYRLRISAGVLAVLLYISLEMPLPGMMNSMAVKAACCFGLQAAILLLALDVASNALTNAFELRFGADGLALTACLFTGIDALIVALSDTAAPHMPLCAISSASVVGLLLAAYLSARGLRKATRVPAIGKHFFAVTGENTLEANEVTLLKSMRSASGFVRRTEEAGPDETFYRRLAPLLFVLALLLSLIVMVVKQSYPEFLYIFSAQLALAVPFGAMLSFALPFFLGSTRIFKFGAAIAGWSGLCDIGMSKNLIVTDRDLFPESAVSIESVRIFADEDAQKVISYAGSMMEASGCCAAGCFGELMRETDSPARHIEGFEVMPGGGMKGVIDGHVVLCGSTDLMRLMNVRIPFRLTDKTTVLLAIDGILYGIFSLQYEGQPQIRRALVDLVRTARPPVFAVRDFNVNPEMLHNTFDLATDGYDFPPYVERFRLSEPSDDRKGERITAILCNEGLAPLTSAVDIGRSMYFATRVNLVLNVLASVLGVFLVFFRFLATGSNSLASLFLFMVAWTLPVLAVSFFVSVKR